jgi:uncharacterized protein (TIGR02246 family)
MRFLATVMLLSSLAAACAQPAPAPAPAPTPKPDLAAEERAIRDADARWLKIAQARDAAGEGRMFTADGIAVRQGGEFTGPAAIEAIVAKDYAANPKSQTTWTTDSIRVAESGELAVQTGQTHTVNAGPKGVGENRARFVTAWRKINGEWKVAYDMSTPIPTQPPPKKS